jgi:hypothetical protein
MWLLNGSFVAHTWNKLSADHLVQWDSETQPYAVLARKHCPLVSRLATEAAGADVQGKRSYDVPKSNII